MEIKFRVWVKEKKKLGVVHFIDFLNRGTLVFIRGLKDTQYYLFNEIVLEQYTGLKDKNGKKIYEGDICKISYFGKWVNVAVERHTTDFIVVNRKGEDYVGRALGGYANVIEIIGNIHENGGLLG